MPRLANRLLANQPLRVGLIAASFPLPLLAIGSAALLTAVAQLHGWRVAAQDAAIALTLLSVVAAVAGTNWQAVALAAGLTWAVAALAGHLRASASLNLAAQVVVLIGVAATVTLSSASTGLEAAWTEALRSIVESGRTSGIEVMPEELVTQVAGILTGVLGASVTLTTLCALFLGCWLVDEGEPTRFAREFRELAMGRVLAGVAVLIAAAALLDAAAFADDLFLVVAVGFVLQGLAIAHWHAADRSWPRAWALALYLPLLLVPAVAVVEIVLLGLAGLLDNVIPLRRNRRGITQGPG